MGGDAFQKSCCFLSSVLWKFLLLRGLWEELELPASHGTSVRVWAHLGRTLVSTGLLLSGWRRYHVTDGSIWDRALFPRAQVVSSERSYFPNTSLGPAPYFSGSYGLSTPQPWRVHAKGPSKLGSEPRLWEQEGDTIIGKSVGDFCKHVRRALLTDRPVLAGVVEVQGWTCGATV